MVRLSCLKGLALAFGVVSLSFGGDAQLISTLLQPILGSQQMPTYGAGANAQVGVGAGAGMGGGLLGNLGGLVGSVVALPGQVLGSVVPAVGAVPNLLGSVVPPVAALPAQLLNSAFVALNQVLGVFGPAPPKGLLGFPRGPGRWSDYQLGGPISGIDQQCNSNWQYALLNEMMNTNNWKCWNRPSAQNSAVLENCVLTGPAYPVTPSVTPAPFNRNCRWTLPVFCDNTVNDLANSLIRGAPPVGPSPTPTAGYMLYGDTYYKVHPELKNWVDAQAACVAEGGNLAVPARSNDYAMLMNALGAAIPTHTGAYIGYTDAVQEGKFVSVTGQPSCQLANIPFAAGDPNNGAGGPVENCLIIVGTAMPATVYDTDCTQLKPFVCEIQGRSRTMCPY